MKLKLKKLLYVSLRIVILALCIIIGSSTSCNRGRCDKPTTGSVDMIIPIRLTNSSPIASCEAYGTGLLADYKSSGAMALGTSFISSSDKPKERLKNNL